MSNMQNDTPRTRMLHYQRILSLKIARVLIASYRIGKNDEAFAKISRAISGVDADFIELNSDKSEFRKWLQNWDQETQSEIGKIKPSRRNTMKRWDVIWKRYEREVNTIYQTRTSPREPQTKSDARK